MKRTYRSKKDAGGALDRRDVLHNLDEKSSVFDAFYIQNIKQTKRDISCAGSSGQYSMGLKKVRKRKYVKRITKDVETVCQDSVSQSTYLTPDKSIRVNKILDPFDMLLNSSTGMSPSQDSQFKPAFNVINRSETKPQRVGKTYARKKPIRKKYDYSSSSDSSEKENASYNTTNIGTYELLVEKELLKPKCVDESIYKMVNNIEFLKEVKNQSSDSSNETSLKYRQHRLTKKIQSPILQKSPLCSTPFKQKYRGESIFKFSPINMKGQGDSPNFITVVEQNNDSNTSIIFVPKNISIHKSQCSMATPVTNYNKKESIDESNELNNKPNLSFLINDNHMKNLNEITEEITKVQERALSSIEFSTLQTTEMEPFYGFTHNSGKGSIDDSIMVKDMQIQNLDVEIDTEDINKKSCSDIEDSLCIESISLNSEDDNESCYDTCNSKDSISEKENKIRSRQPTVLLQRMNDSMFMKYYKKKGSHSSNEKTDESTDSSNNDNFASFETTSNSSQSMEIESEVEFKEEADLATEYCLSSNDDEENSSNNNDEERCISFVTTRRRNEITNNSIISMFDDSCTSDQYAEIDKTVISNNVTYRDAEYDLDIKSDESVHHERVEENKPIENKGTPKSSMIDKTIFITTDFESNVKDTCQNNENELLRSSHSRSSVIMNPVTSSITIRKSTKVTGDDILNSTNIETDIGTKPSIVLHPGKKWERSLSIYRRMTMVNDNFDHSMVKDESLQKKGRKYRQSVVSTMELQDYEGSLHDESIHSRRSTFVSKPARPTICIIKESDSSRSSLHSTTLFDDLRGFLSDECDETIVELSKLSIDVEHEVTVLENFHETSERQSTARDYLLRRCNQTDAIPFDECYPDTVLKNCHKIGEGVYGEVFLYRDRDGRGRVMKIVPIAGLIKVNGESQKNFDEIISEVVIAMELSALRTPIAEIDRQYNEAKEIDVLDLQAIENATDVFNQVLAVRCVNGSYPSRLLDLWELYDECKGSENDNPAVLPPEQRFVVLELANAGQDLESYQFNSAEQAHALFLQVAYGLAVGEEAFQFEHRDLHWGNVLIAPTDQKFATFVLRGRAHRVPRGGVAATIIDYSLSRLSLPLAGERAALYSDLAGDDSLFNAVGDHQFTVYRLMREKLRNDWKNFEPYTNILWLHYTVDKMITALRYKRTNTKIHKHYIEKLKGIKNRILDFGSAAQLVLTDNEL